MNIVWELTKSEKHSYEYLTPPNPNIVWFYEKELEENKN